MVAAHHGGIACENDFLAWLLWDLFHVLADNKFSTEAPEHIFMDCQTPGNCVLKKSLAEMNKRIRNGSAHVITAEEMPDIVDELGSQCRSCARGGCR